MSAAEAGKRQADATIERARVALELARTELARRQLLASRNAGSRQELELARVREGDSIVLHPPDLLEAGARVAGR